MTPKEMFESYNKVYLVDVKVQENGWKFEMIDYSVSYGEVWSIMKITRPDQSIVYDLSVSKISYTGNKEHYNYYVKEISVSGGPCFYKCPKKYVDKIRSLNPSLFEFGYGAGWLESWKEVQESNKKKAKIKRDRMKMVLKYRPNYSKPYSAI